MTAKLRGALATGAFAALAAASIAQAQPAAPARPAAAAPAAPPITHGPPIANVCVISANQAINTSTVGQYVSQRMETIIGQVKAEVTPEETALGNEARALDAARATLDGPTYQSRGANLQLRASTLQKKEELRQREIEATEQKAISRMAQELDPVVRAVYQQKQCSILIDKGATVFVNPGMDITAAAVTGLNARIQRFDFDREHLDAPGAPAAPAR